MVRRMRCGNLACVGKPFTEHRNIPNLRPDPADRRLEWEQVADGVRAAIRSGQLTSGDTLPSVPDLARLQGLKPGTVRHAFLALAGEGLARASAQGFRLVVLVGDVPYYGRFGFVSVPPGQITLPGPVDPKRLLALELVAGALSGAVGPVTAMPHR